jgi:hypothetical protein
MRIRGRMIAMLAGIGLLWGGVGAALGVNGVILEQQLSAGKGYTVLRVWGTDYEMGYAQANLMGDYIVSGVTQTKTLLGSSYATARSMIANTVWMPAGIEDELDGMVASLAETHPSANIDALDLKVVNTQGDWGYACRSHTCWGRYVTGPIKTLSTRRLDYGTPIPMMNHHVLCARDPSDGSPRWVNMAFPGMVTSATGANEYGTLVSLHDYSSAPADRSAGVMPRMVACRYALTFANGGNISGHLSSTYSELQQYQVMTGSFVNYYAPEGNGGVMVCNPYRTGPDFYYLRVPQSAWHHGEAMITTNAWTDGTYTPSDAGSSYDTYYNDESAKTSESHWNLLSGSGLHKFHVAYRGRGDMMVWGIGRLDPGTTPRLEWEWSELFCSPADLDHDGDVDGFDFLTFSNCYNSSINPPLEGCQNVRADLDDDGDVDGFDFLSFSNCFNGSNNPARCP